MLAQQRTAGLPRSSSGSLVELGGMQGRLSKEITQSRRKLIDQGLHSLLENVITDLKVRICRQRPSRDSSSSAETPN